MPISITYWRDVLRKLTTTEMDNNFENLVNAIEDSGLSSTMPEGQIYIGDNTNTASLATLDTSIVPETTNKNYQTDNQKLFNDATSSIQTQIDSKEPTIASGTTSQYWRGDKTWQTFPTISVPSLDEVTDAGNTTTNSITVGGLVVDYPSGLGVAVEITKGGAGEALTVNKTSGSGNVASFNNGTTLVKDLEVSTATANRPTFFDSSKKLITATGSLLGTWFQTLTAKSTPVGADTIIVNDSASSFETKKTTLTELWTNYLRAFVFSATLSTNRIPRANGSGVLVDGVMTDDGTNVTLPNSSILKLTHTDAATIIKSLVELNGVRLISASSEGSTWGNLFFGKGAGKLGSYANNAMTGIGDRALEVCNADYVTALGALAGKSNTTGAQNTYLGAYAGRDNQTGNSNVYVGARAGLVNKGGGNIIIGASSFTNATASGGCIIIGSAIAGSETGNYKLWIEGASRSQPLIGGDFNSQYVNISGTVSIGVGSTAPNSSSSLDLQGTTKGFLPNRLTTTQRDAVSWVAGDAGMMIYNSTVNKHQGWNGTTWNDMY